MAIKHAFLIGAYKNPDYLLELIDSLDSERSNFYIHVNKNNDKEFDDFKQKIAKRNNIHYYSVIPVQWGGITMMKSQILLCEEALKDTENEYFHFVTGQDILIKPLNDFFDFFQDSNMSYISYSLMDKKEINYRFNFYHLFDVFNMSYNKVDLGRTLERIIRYAQKIVRIRYQRIPFDSVYQGSPWWSLHREAMKLCIGRISKDKRILKRFKHTFAPDETVFHSILLSPNSAIPVMNDNLRYIVWDESYVGGQKLLVVEDLDNLIKTSAFFARKVDPNDTMSRKLIDIIHHTL